MNHTPLCAEPSCGGSRAGRDSWRTSAQEANRLRVTGFAFYGGFHYSNADPQHGRDHGTAFVGTLREDTSRPES
jgi:hypothetical protein